MLWEDMCSRWACFAGLCRSNHLSWCESRHLVFFFFLQLFSWECQCITFDLEWIGEGSIELVAF